MSPGSSPNNAEGMHWDSVGRRLCHHHVGNRSYTLVAMAATFAMHCATLPTQPLICPNSPHHLQGGNVASWSLEATSLLMNSSKSSTTTCNYLRSDVTGRTMCPSKISMLRCNDWAVGSLLCSRSALLYVLANNDCKSREASPTACNAKSASKGHGQYAICASMSVWHNRRPMYLSQDYTTHVCKFNTLCHDPVCWVPLRHMSQTVNPCCTKWSTCGFETIVATSDSFEGKRANLCV